MKPITESITREILGRALETQLENISLGKKEDIAKKLFAGQRDLPGVRVRLPLSEKREVDAIACKYLHEQAFCGY
jgi:hypothetical protein